MAILESVASSRRKVKEGVKLDNLIPRQLREESEVLIELMNSYYEFMNLFAYYYKKQEQTFYATVIDENLIFRTETGEYFFDSLLEYSKLYDPNGDEVEISNIGTYIAGTDNLPEALSDDVATYGRLFFIDTGDLGNYNFKQMRLVTPTIVYAGDSPSHTVLNLLEQRDIDTIREAYLEMIQKEIAATLPRALQSDKKLLYKNIAQFYRERGSVESIKVFFRLLLNDEVEVTYPGEQMLIPSSGDWDATSPSSVPSFDVEGNITGYSPGVGRYLDRKGQLSNDQIRIQDSNFYQKFSYLIRTGSNLDTWGNAFNKLIHPAGFKFFGEIVMYINMVRESGLTKIDQYRALNSTMPLDQPGLIGAEDVALVFELFARLTNPTFSTQIDIATGAVTSIDVVDSGYKYDVIPDVIVSAPNIQSGTQATAEVILTNGRISDINITNAGSGYTFEPTITIDGKVNRVSEFLPTIVLNLKAIAADHKERLNEQWKNITHFYDNTPMFVYGDITFEGMELETQKIYNNVGTEIYEGHGIDESLVTLTDVTTKLQQPRL